MRWILSILLPVISGGVLAAESPRFTAVSETFEMVGIVEGKSLTVYLDRFDDNSPVKGASIDLELDGAKVALKPSGDGLFAGELSQPPAVGVATVVAMVTAGNDTDLLSGELDVHGESAEAGHRHDWRELLPWVPGIGMLVILVGGWLLLRRRRGAAAIAVLLVLTTAMEEPLAGEGHDHGDAAAPANPNAPQRLADGTVFLPKPAQRQLGIRTVTARKEVLARAIELNGRIVMDPNAGGKVQSTVPGRLEPGAKGLPGIGERVTQGQVLAYVVPSLGTAERSSQAAALAELRAARALAEKRLARFRDLTDTVPRKEIEAAESEVAGLTERIAALGQGLSGRESLVAPVAGAIASSNAVAGQIVDARELVFEIVDPRRMRVEALAYDPAIARDIAGASLALGGERVKLAFIGAGQALREQALPLMFRGEGEILSRFALGQPVKVVVQMKSTGEGLAVPVASLARDPGNRTIVWVKTAPERFAPRPVVVEPLDGVRASVTSGLQPDDRVVTTGAALVNQIR